MALTTTTLSSAVAVGDTTITVASATGFAAGSFVQIDQEMLRVVNSYVSGTTISVLRGLNGTTTTAHPVTANVTVGLASDFAIAVPGGPEIQQQAQRARTIASYTAAGAIALPTSGSDAVAIINGTNALAMTLANPDKTQDGDILYIVGNGKAAHTVTYTAGLGNGGANLDVLTFAAGGQQCVAVIAVNAIWVPLPSVLAGTLTNITVTAS